MDVLKEFRERIQDLDQQLAAAISERLRICAKIAEVKKENGIPMMQPDQVDRVRSAYAERGRVFGISPDFMQQVATLLINEACRLEDEVIGVSTDGVVVEPG